MKALKWTAFVLLTVYLCLAVIWAAVVGLMGATFVNACIIGLSWPMVIPFMLGWAK